jgi:CheY-like chemotaxis protein
MKNGNNIENKSKILVIDDDIWVQRVLVQIFSRMGISNVFLANNGFEGVNLAIKKKPDVIFLDLMMPDISGLYTLKMLKTIDLTKEIPIIIISVNSDYLNLSTAISSGAVDFISKPFTFATIIEKFDKIFGEGVADKLEKGISLSEDTIFEEEIEDFNANEAEENEFNFEYDSISDVESIKENEELLRKYKRDAWENSQEIKKILNKK